MSKRYKEPKSGFIPLDTLSLDYSISAVANNLVLFCKSCKSLKRSNFNPGSYSGLVGIISKGIFQIYQLDVNSDGIAYKLQHIIQTTNIANPTVRPVITAAKWVRLRRNFTALVVSSNMGIHIHSEDGSHVICQLLFKEPLPQLLCRNIVSTKSQILLGNGRGEVNVFDFIDGKIQFRKTSCMQNELISEMCCRRGILATGSPSGTIRLWRVKERRAVNRCTFKTPTEECVTGLGIWESCLIATYGSGIIRVFHIGRKKLLAKVMAHSRWIVCMDLLPHEGLILTVAEDDAILTWKLKGQSDSRRNRRQRHSKVSIELDSSIHTENMLLVGGKFLSCDGNILALANYGVKEIYFFSRIQESFDC